MFVHVGDVVQGFVSALERPEVSIGQIYIISDVRAYSYEEIYNIMADIFDKQPPRTHIPVWLAKVMVAPVQGINYLRRKPNFIWRISTMDTFRFNRSYSSVKARRDLGYEPRHPLPAGLRETAAWYREEGLIKG
jgi:nucleoside-diphosphate-sugar epimerase